MYWIFKESENCYTELGEKSINTNRNNNDERLLQSTELKPATVCILYMFKMDFKKSMRTEIEDIKKKNPNEMSTDKKIYTISEKLLYLKITPTAIFKNRYQRNIHYFVCNSASTGKHLGSIMNRRTRTICTSVNDPIGGLSGGH